MRVGFIGCVQSSKQALESILSLNEEGINVVAVITKSISDSNSDHCDLTPICVQNKIPVHQEILPEKNISIEFMRSHMPDVIFCFGWSFLLAREMLDIPSRGTFGFHPAKLPANRGRHPLIWALALGLKSTASTFFLMDERADSGPIISQEHITIEQADDASKLYEKVMNCAVHQIMKFTRELASGTEKLQIQDESRANYWRKRSRKDGLIDFRMRAIDIHNLVKALSHPYPGAEVEYKENFYVIWESELSLENHPENIEPGFVLDRNNNNVLVKCADNSAVWLLNLCGDELPLKKGEYL